MNLGSIISPEKSETTVKENLDLPIVSFAESIIAKTSKNYYNSYFARVNASL